MIVPPGVKPSFVKTRDEISPSEINKKLHSGPSYRLAAIQFLEAMNIYFGGEKKLSQNIMSEFFHIMSLQALTIDDDDVKTEFDAIIELNKNLKSLIRDDTTNDINIIDFKQRKFDEIKDKNQLIEEKVVNNIINDVQIEYPQDIQNLSFPNTASEIKKDTKANNLNDNITFEAFNIRDEEISQELITTARNDLIKSVTDAEGKTPIDVLNNITTTFEIQKEDKTEKRERTSSNNNKKNNEQYLKKTKEGPISEEASVSQSTEPVKLTDYWQIKRVQLEDQNVCQKKNHMINKYLNRWTEAVTKLI